MTNAVPPLLAGALALLASTAAGAGVLLRERPAVPIAGVVRGPAGEPVAGARVTVEGHDAAPSTATNEAGRFFLPDLPPDAKFLRVEAAGFDPARVRIPTGSAGRELALTLSPRRVSEAITVTAARAPRQIGDTPASVVLLSGEDLAVSAAPTADDALRQVAGFSLFRRSGSRTANPTTQGVSLRGTGASGASRASVLEDGVPLNDPFGGWVYWGRVPLPALERAEVVRGGASQLYGSPALGGAIQLIARSPSASPALHADASWGSLDSRDAALFATMGEGAFAAALSAEAFSTGGYVLVPDPERGPVDARASSRHATANLTLERRGEGSRLFLRGSVYDESRENGTALQGNDVREIQGSTGAEATAGRTSWSVRGYGNEERFHQTFTAIAADRSAERVTRFQTVPANALGLNAQGSRLVGAHLLVAGVEARRVSGESREEIPGPPSPSFVTAGGRESTAALFFEDVVAAGQSWTWTGGARLDAWSNEDGRRDSSGGSAPASTTRFPRRSETAWSPRLSALYRAGKSVSLTASAYRSFRAPTLNELYRSFRVGNVATSANEALRPERSTGGETSLVLDPAASRLHARATLFWMEIDDAIGNRTLSSTPALVTRRRENLGTIRSRGVEADAEARFDAWKIRAGYLFADSTVLDAPGAPAIVGLRVPQVPRHQGTLQVEYRRDGTAAAIQARAGGAQFEDDENRLGLRAFWTADVFCSRILARGIEPYIAVENVLNRSIEVGRTPVTTLGAPREVRLGVKVRLGN